MAEVIQSEKKRLISGIRDLYRVGWKQRTHRLSRNLQIECIRAQIDLWIPRNGAADGIDLGFFEFTGGLPPIEYTLSYQCSEIDCSFDPIRKPDPQFIAGKCFDCRNFYHKGIIALSSEAYKDSYLVIHFEKKGENYLCRRLLNDSSI